MMFFMPYCHAAEMMPLHSIIITIVATFSPLLMFLHYAAYYAAISLLRSPPC